MASSLLQHIFLGHKSGKPRIKDAIKVIRLTDYKIFEWNGELYRVLNSPKAKPLGEPLGITLGDAGIFLDSQPIEVEIRELANAVGELRISLEEKSN